MQSPPSDHLRRR
uniref:Uncharacterized protein n=1 Tax=Arundo donax TaxID=35708 RepID=A0A0A9CHB3_ARUDO